MIYGIRWAGRQGRGAPVNCLRAARSRPGFVGRAPPKTEGTAWAERPSRNPGVCSEAVIGKSGGPTLRTAWSYETPSTSSRVLLQVSCAPEKDCS